MNMYYKQQAGVSLIEVLVTTLILGIGLLGVAALQVSSISSNQEGFFASQATSIAEDFASRIRSSKISTQMPNTSITHPLFIAAYRQPDSNAIDCSAAPAVICRTDGSNESSDCTPTELVNFDKWEACTTSENTLPGGQLRVINNGRRLTIVVDWDSSVGRADIGNETIVNSRCSALTGSDIRNCIIMELVP